MPEPTHSLPPKDWRDVLRDFGRLSRSQVIIAVVLAICAFAVVTQVQSRTQDDSYASLRRTDLVSLLDDLTNESRRLEKEVSDLEATKRQLQSGADARNVAREEARKRLESLELLAGTIPAEGPGVRFVIYDPAEKMTPEILLNAIEEMRDAGGEVIEFNDSIRLGTNSSVEMTASGLTVDGKRVTQPITMEVIGNPQTLAEAARFRGGLVSTVESARVGGSVTIRETDSLRIESVREPLEMKHSRPA